MKNVGDAGFSRKRGGNAGSGPLLPDPERLEIAQHFLTASWPDHGRINVGYTLLE